MHIYLSMFYLTNYYRNHIRYDASMGGSENFERWFLNAKTILQ